MKIPWIETKQWSAREIEIRKITELEEEYLKLHIEKIGKCDCENHKKWILYKSLGFINTGSEIKEELLYRHSIPYLILICNYCYQIKIIYAYNLLE